MNKEELQESITQSLRFEFDTTEIILRRKELIKTNVLRGCYREAEEMANDMIIDGDANEKECLELLKTKIL